MKTGIHPEYMDTKVHCNGCNIEFTSRSTVPTIEVEICSNCHPFYTGKQRLVDTAGRVDKFKARQEAAAKHKEDAKPKKARAKKDEAIAEIVEDPEQSRGTDAIKAETVDTKNADAKPEAPAE